MIEPTRQLKHFTHKEVMEKIGKENFTEEPDLYEREDWDVKAEMISIFY